MQTTVAQHCWGVCLCEMDLPPQQQSRAPWAALSSKEVNGMNFFPTESKARSHLKYHPECVDLSHRSYCPAVVLVWTVSSRNAPSNTHFKVIVVVEISWKSFHILFYLKKSFFHRSTISLQYYIINRFRVIIRGSRMSESVPTWSLSHISL